MINDKLIFNDKWQIFVPLESLDRGLQRASNQSAGVPPSRRGGTTETPAGQCSKF